MSVTDEEADRRCPRGAAGRARGEARQEELVRRGAERRAAVRCLSNGARHRGAYARIPRAAPALRRARRLARRRHRSTGLLYGRIAAGAAVNKALMSFVLGNASSRSFFASSSTPAKANPRGSKRDSASPERRGCRSALAVTAGWCLGLRRTRGESGGSSVDSAWPDHLARSPRWRRRLCLRGFVVTLVEEKLSLSTAF